MNRTLVISILGGIAVLCFIGGLALRFQNKMEDGLPPQSQCANRAEALDAAVHAAGPGVPIYAVVGTGSMVPYLPAAPAGQVPLDTVVAYAVPRASATFADIQEGDLCTYRADWLPDPANCVMHQAAMKDHAGWIMSGLHNKSSESGDRVTARNFRAIVARTYVWNLNKTSHENQ